MSHPLLWLGGALGLLLLAKPSAAATLQPLPPPIPTEKRVAVPIPSGYRRLSQAEVTPALAASARVILDTHGSDPYGTFFPLPDGYAAMIEQHYHEPGGPVKPWGLHHGVTLLVQSVQSTTRAT